MAEPVIPPAETAAPAVAAAPAEPVLGKDGTPFDPQRAQGTIDKLRDELKLARDAQKQREDADTKAAEATAREQGKFQELAEKHKAEAETLKTQLETAHAEREAAFGIINNEAKERLEKLPEGVRKFVPSEKDATPLARLAKIAELETIAEAAKPSTPGLHPPKGAAISGAMHPPEPKPQRTTLGML